MTSTRRTLAQADHCVRDVQAGVLERNFSNMCQELHVSPVEHVDLKGGQAMEQRLAVSSRADAVTAARGQQRRAAQTLDQARDEEQISDDSQDWRELTGCRCAMNRQSVSGAGRAAGGSVGLAQTDR